MSLSEVSDNEHILNMCCKIADWMGSYKFSGEQVSK